MFGRWSGRRAAAAVFSWRRVSSALMKGPRDLLQRYDELISSRNFKQDPHQRAILKYLTRLCVYLDGEQMPQVQSAEQQPKPEEGAQPRAKGLYIWGPVGTGKTMLMDLFFAHLPHTVAKRRVHFHAFMLEVHQRIFIYKQKLLQAHGRDIHINLSSERDAISHVAKQMAAEAKVLCFDEFQVTDVADAMIIAKFFNTLWSEGTILVATSNRPPSDLYKDGLNRSYFLPFLAALERLNVVKEIGGQDDYRQQSSRAPGSFYTPLGADSEAQLWHDFNSAHEDKDKDEQPTPNYKIRVMMGRFLTLPHAKPVARTCFTTFADLCEGDRGASDYKALVQHFDRVYLSGVPQLSVLGHDKARRFITLVDALYDAHTQLIWTAETDPKDLFRFLTTDADTDEEGSEDGGWGGGEDESPDGAMKEEKEEDVASSDPWRAGRAEAKRERARERRPSRLPAPLGTDHHWGAVSTGDVGGWRYTSAVDHSKFGAVVSRGLREKEREKDDSSTGAGGKGVQSTSDVPRLIPRVDTGVTSARLSVGLVDSTRTRARSDGINSSSNSNSNSNSSSGDNNSSAVVGRLGVDAAQEELKLLEGELASVQELSFAFRRCASRLTEMSSKAWRAP